MLNLIRRLLTVGIATFIAVSVMLVPANAAAMADCEDHVGAVQFVEGHDHEVLSERKSDHDAKPHLHPESHCASHVCVFGVSVVPASLVEIGLLPDAGPVGLEPSLISDVLPDGLRRPPRA